MRDRGLVDRIEEIGKIGFSHGTLPVQYSVVFIYNLSGFIWNNLSSLVWFLYLRRKLFSIRIDWFFSVFTVYFVN